MKFEANRKSISIVAIHCRVTERSQMQLNSLIAQTRDLIIIVGLIKSEVHSWTTRGREFFCMHKIERALTRLESGI